MTGPDDFARFSGTDGVRKSLKQKSVRGAVFVASGGGLDLLLRIVSIAVLARLLMPEYFGLIAMVTAFTGIAEGIRDLGLATATVQRHEISHRQVTNLFWVNAAAGALFALLFCALSPAIASFYQDDRLAGATMAISLTFLWSGLSVQHEALMSRQLKQGELAAIRLLASFLSIVAAVGLALGGWGYWALVWREVIRSALIALGVWIRCPWVPGLPSKGAGTRGLLRFGRDLTLTHLLTSLIANIDRVLIGRFYGPSPVGLYRQAQQLLMVPIDQLNAPITAVARPGLSALQREPDRYCRYYEKIVFLVMLATFPLGLFIAVYAEEVTLLLLGPTWSEAAVFVRIFGVAAAIRPAIGTSAVVLITTGQSGKYLTVAVVHGVLLAILMIFGVRWGAEGVAVAHVATTLILMVPKLYYSFTGTPITLGVFFHAVRTPLVAGAAMLAGLVMLRSLTSLPGVVLPLFTGVAVGGTLYLAVWLLQRKGRRQLRTMTSDLASALGTDASVK
jgi:O-antigen/teichoic acid export membrane protein